LSDYFTRRAATAAGVADLTVESLKPFAGEGLHMAMYAVPVLNICLAVVLLAASRTVTGDVRRLKAWMQSAAHDAAQNKELVGA
jgi:hypothetical protein